MDNKQIHVNRERKTQSNLAHLAKTSVVHSDGRLCKEVPQGQHELRPHSVYSPSSDPRQSLEWMPLIWSGKGGGHSDARHRDPAQTRLPGAADPGAAVGSWAEEVTRLVAWWGFSHYLCQKVLC